MPRGHQPSSPASDGLARSSVICASRTARCLRSRAPDAGITLRRGGRAAREASPRREAAVAFLARHGDNGVVWNVSRSGARRNKERNLRTTNNRRQRQRQQRRVHARARREERCWFLSAERSVPPSPRIKAPSIISRLRRTRRRAAEFAPVEERDVFEARTQTTRVASTTTSFRPFGNSMTHVTVSGVWRQENSPQSPP